MDVDVILARKPAVVLVDELAHTNIEGSKHPKRYQDVLDLLDAKIDVVSTVNVQHIESLNPLVERSLVFMFVKPFPIGWCNAPKRSSCPISPQKRCRPA